MVGTPLTVLFCIDDWCAYETGCIFDADIASTIRTLQVIHTLVINRIGVNGIRICSPIINNSRYLDMMFKILCIRYV